MPSNLVEGGARHRERCATAWVRMLLPAGCRGNATMHFGKVIRVPAEFRGRDMRHGTRRFFLSFAGNSGSFLSYTDHTSPGVSTETAPPNHSPLFKVDESGLLAGLRAVLHLVADYTGSGAT